jgi:tetratricopeptide (TPR) repeat protein
VIAAILVLGTAVSAWQAVEARQAQREAENQRVEAVAAEKRAEAEKTNAIAALDFISNEILAQASPDIGADPNVKLRTVVDLIAKSLDKGAKQPPLVEASIRLTLGKIYVNLERYPDALRHFKEAYHIRQSALGERHPDTIRAMVWFAFRYLHEDEERKALEPLAFRAWTMAKEVLGARDFHTLIAMRNVASVHHWRREFVEAERLYRQFLKDCDDTRGPADTWSITARNDLAWYYLSRNRFKEAEEYAAEALKLRRRHLDDEHYLTLLAEETLLEVHIRQGRYDDEVEKRCERLGEGFRKQIGDRSLSHLHARGNLGWVLNRRGKHEEAVKVFQDLIPLLKKVETSKRIRFQLALDLTIQGDSLNKLQRFADAEDGLREALRIREKDLGPDSSRACNTRSTLGETLLGLKQFKEAEEYLKAAYHGQLKVFAARTDRKGLPFDTLTDTLERLVQFYVATGNQPEAATWRKKLQAWKEAKKN